MEEQLTEYEQRRLKMMRLGLTQRRFAQMTNVSQTMINLWLRGRTTSKRIDREFERITNATQKQN